MELKVYVAVLGPVGTNCYIAINDETKKAIIVDAAANPERLIRAVEKHGATLEALLLTHAHWDHTAAVNELLEMMPELPVYIGENEASLLADPTFNVSRWLDGTAGSVDPSKVKTVHDGEEMSLIGTTFRCLEVPGHTRGSMCYYFEDQKIVFAGDTLFQGSIGRSDLPTGDEDTLIRSIKEKLLVLPEDVKVYPGHGMGTSIKAEKAYNPFLS